jgi:alkylhydroperoxidase/carboxymuconolactone decarboxylase family protein YurZ
MSDESTFDVDEDADEFDDVGGPVVETLAAMTAAALENCELEPHTMVLVRIAALAAVGAPPASYLLNLGVGVEVGLSLEDVEGVLTAIAPIIGAPRVIAASDAVSDALGMAVAVVEADLVVDELALDE